MLAVLYILPGVIGILEAGGDGPSLRIPPLNLLKTVVSSTAARDFADNTVVYEAAAAWDSKKLRMMDAQAPYLACAEYGKGQEARVRLERALSPASVKLLSHTKEHGTCFLASATPSDAAVLSERLEEHALTSAGPYLRSLKIAPDLLDQLLVSDAGSTRGSSRRLRTSSGKAAKDQRPRGLTVRLTPGTTVLREGGVGALFDEWREAFVSQSLDLWRATFWSDPDVRQEESDDHPADHAEGLERIQEWSRAAQVVHDLADARGLSPGEFCGWGAGSLHLVDDDLLVIEGTFRARVQVLPRVAMVQTLNVKSDKVAHRSAL